MDWAVLPALTFAVVVVVLMFLVFLLAIFSVVLAHALALAHAMMWLDLLVLFG